MDISVNSNNNKFKQRARLISAITHVVFLILLLIPFLTLPDPPPGQEGITVNLGVPEFDEVEEPAPSAANTDPEPEPVVEEKQVEKVNPEPPKPETQPVKEPEVIEAEDPAQIALKKKQEEARQERLRQEREEQARKEAEAEARRQAEEDRKRQEAEAAANKEKFSDLFKNSSGDGTGDKQSGGDPDGKPNTGNLDDKLSTGSGTVGGELTGRGRPTSSPKVTDNSQKEGTVVIKVCVDAGGNVISSRYTQGGSTTGDAALKRLAESNAMKWKFPKGTQTDCGTITYAFKVK